MCIPTNEEYDRLLDTAGEDESRTHWDNIYSWVDDKKEEYCLDAYNRAVRGCVSARYWNNYHASYRSGYVGFRPAFELCEIDTLAPKGELSIVGTLYMDGEPVEVPMVPTYCGDVAEYIPGAKLEIRTPVNHPGYIITGYRVGDVVIADRALLNGISCLDIEKALQGG